MPEIQPITVAALLVLVMSALIVRSWRPRRK
jgi:hypothetical protein